MSAPTPPAAISLRWVIKTVHLGGTPVPVARLRTEVDLPLMAPTGVTVTEPAWLDTGAPLSVIPSRVRNLGLAWAPLPGVRATSAGQPCDVGHVEVWAPDAASGALRGPLALLAKLPHSDPPGDPVPVLLGLEFLLRHHSSLALDPPPGQGTIRIP